MKVGKTTKNRYKVFAMIYDILRILSSLLSTGFLLIPSNPSVVMWKFNIRSFYQVNYILVKS